MNNTDTENTGYTIHLAKVRENRIGNRVWTIKAPPILGTQFTEQRLEKTEGAIKNEQHRHRQHWVHNTYSIGKKKPNWQSSMDNPDTDNTGYTIHRTKVKENRRGDQVWTIQSPTTLGTQSTEQRL